MSRKPLELDILVPWVGVSSQRWAYEQAQMLSQHSPVRLRAHGFAAGGREFASTQYPGLQVSAHNGRWLARVERLVALREPRLAPTVIAHFADTALNWMPQLRRDEASRLMVYCHGRDAIAPQHRGGTDRSAWSAALARRTNWLVERTEHWLCASAYLRDVIIEQYGVPESNVSTRYIGVDTQYFRPDKEPDTRPRVVLYVGRLDEQKGVHNLLQAWSELTASARRNCRLVLAGPEGNVSMPGSLDGVRAIGVLTKHQLRDWYRRASLVVVPSLANYQGRGEGLGIVSLEAQACGTAVLVSPSGGLPETVADGSAKFVLPDEGERSLRSALEELLADPVGLLQAGEDARRNVVDRFDLRDCSARLIDQLQG